MHTPTPAALRGLSLVELLMTLALVAILVTLAVPSFASVLRSVHLSSGANLLLASIRLARSEAVRRGGRITICKSADGDACAERGGWEQGWMVFQDLDGDGRRDAGETLIQHYGPLEAGYRLTGNAPLARGLTVNAQGVQRSLSGGMLAGTLTLCRGSAGPTEARKIVVSSGGRPRLQQVSVARCP